MLMSKARKQRIERLKAVLTKVPGKLETNLTKALQAKKRKY